MLALRFLAVSSGSHPGGKKESISALFKTNFCAGELPSSKLCALACVVVANLDLEASPHVVDEHVEQQRIPVGDVEDDLHEGDWQSGRAQDLIG